jgi:hypothetical protein
MKRSFVRLAAILVVVLLAVGPTVAATTAPPPNRVAVVASGWNWLGQLLDSLGLGPGEPPVPTSLSQEEGPRIDPDGVSSGGVPAVAGSDNGSQIDPNRLGVTQKAPPSQDEGPQIDPNG